jgi:hypothetical protein
MKTGTLLDNGPKAIAVLTFVILLMTILHDWGYFWFVGSRFLSIQTPYDHLANSIEWLPLNLAFIIITLTFAGLVFPGRGSEFRTQFQDARRRSTRRSLIRTGMLVMAVGAITLITPFFVVSANIAYVFFVLAFAIVTEGVSAILIALLIGKPQWLLMSILIVPQLVFLSFVSGHLEARIDLASTHNVYQITTKGGPPLTATLLRNFDKGPLI